MPTVTRTQHRAWILGLWIGFSLLPGGTTAQEPDSVREGAQEQTTIFYATLASSLQNNIDLLRMARLSGFRHLEGQPLAAIAEDYLDLGDVDRAVAYYDSALAVARLSGDPALASRILHGLGRAAHRYRSPPDLSKALAYYAEAAQARAAIRSGAGEDRLKVSAAEQSVDVFADWTAAWLARIPDLGMNVAALGALTAAERGRGQALLDLMTETPDAPLSEAYSPQVTPPATVPIAGLEALPILEQALVTEGSGLVQALTRPHTTILSYLLVGDTLATWIIPPSGEIRLIQQSMVRPSIVESLDTTDTPQRLKEDRLRAAARDSLARLVGAVRASVGAASDVFRSLEQRGTKAVRAVPTVSFQEAAGQLQALLVPPDALSPASTDGTLIIIPYGPIALVPFAALPLDDTVLGARYAIRYAPSLTTLLWAQQAPGTRAPAKETFAEALIVGNPDMPFVEDTQLHPLPAAAEEAAWLADRLSSRPLIGPDATEHAVKAALEAAPLVHLATHGFAYSAEQRTRDSFVALAPGLGQDGLLSVGEVLDETASLDADLVVLSACQTGLGNLTQAEGTIGLQRAFLARGARSVLVSLWNVSDAATALLMKRFYTHWLDEGRSKADALRQAQTDVRTDPRFEDAQFWAAFQLVGAD